MMPKAKKKKMYFTQKHEDAIIQYNNTEDIKERNEIYVNSIEPAFKKLAENVFNTFKFTYFDCEPEVVQQQVVSFMVSNMHKYKPQSKGGGKAFAYFSIVAKNWLILHNNNTWKRWNQHTEILDEPDEDVDGEILIIHDENNEELTEFIELMIEYWEHNLFKIFTKKKEIEIASAIIELFRMSERLENFNKKALYLYIREISGCKTQNITKVINKMKEYQKEITIEYLAKGSISMSLPEESVGEFFK